MPNITNQRIVGQYNLTCRINPNHKKNEWCSSCLWDQQQAVKSASPVKPKTMPKVKKTISKKKTPVKKVAPVPKSTTLTKPRSLSVKKNTLAYYNCIIDQVANPLNEKVKITQLSHHCKCNKGKEAIARDEHKQQLVQQLAQSYQTFGNSLGHYLQADLLGCLKEKPVLKKK